MTNQVSIGGRSFSSQKEAASCLKVSDMAISKAKKEGRIDRIGQGRRGRSVTISGITYISLAAASRALGIPAHKVDMLSEIEQ